MGTQRSQGGEGDTVQAVEPVYVPKNPHLPVKCIYFYYLKHDGTEHPEIQAYRYLVDQGVIRYDAVPGILVTLTRSARAGTLDPVGGSVGSIVWRRKSFIAVVLDDRNDNLIGGNAMQFAGGEHTFRDGTDITLPELDNISAFYCINHMKKNRPDDPDLGHERESFDVCIRTVAFPDCDHHLTRFPILTHYESGTNQGPPL